MAPLGLAVRIARTTLTRRVQTAHRAMNNYRSNSPSPYLREVLYQAKTGLEEGIEEVNRTFATLMAADDPSMFAVYNAMLEAQLELAELPLLDLTDSLFVVDRLLQTPVPFDRSEASRGHSPLRSEDIGAAIDRADAMRAARGIGRPVPARVSSSPMPPPPPPPAPGRSSHDSPQPDGGASWSHACLLYTSDAADE